MERGKYIRTQQHRSNFKKAMLGNKFRLGKKHTEKTKEKIRLSRIGKYNANENPNWRGGKKIVDGYVYVYQPNHPNTTKSKYVLEHRLVMEKHLGRYLDKKEVVHHKDSNRLNNNIENLQLYKSAGIHTMLNHAKKDRYGKFSK